MDQGNVSRLLAEGWGYFSIRRKNLRHNVQTVSHLVYPTFSPNVSISVSQGVHFSGTEGNHLPLYFAEVKNASSWLGAYFSTGRFSPSLRVN